MPTSATTCCQPNDRRSDRWKCGACDRGQGFGLLRSLAWLVGAIALLSGVTPSSVRALDEVVLANGRRYQGTITSDSPEAIVLSFEGGTVELPRSAVVSPPYLGPVGTTAVENAEKPRDEPAQPPPAMPPQPAHPLPGVGAALARVRAFPWDSPVRQLPALVIQRGRWQQVPCTSFWLGGFFQASFLGDPARPAAIELSLPAPAPDSWDRKRQMLEYLFALVPGAATDGRFDRLNLRGDSFAIGDLWFTLTDSNSTDTPGRWVLTLSHEPSLGSSRASQTDLQAISSPLASTAIDPTQPRSWQRGIWTQAELAWLMDPAIAPPASDSATDAVPAEKWNALAGERVFSRAFSRENGRYQRKSSDWLADAAAVTVTPQ